jgi:hypothetical protein
MSNIFESEGWTAVKSSNRPDIIGVRTRSGQTEYLLHNSYMCAQYYVATLYKR